MKGHGKKKDVRTPKLRKEQFLQALGFDFLNADIELSRAGDASDAAAGDAAAEAGPTKLRELFEGTDAELKVAEMARDNMKSKVLTNLHNADAVRLAHALTLLLWQAGC
jgi:hypothetical protein